MKLFIFGSTGNLVKTKVIPALMRGNWPNLQIIALGRRPLTTSSYLTHLGISSSDLTYPLTYHQINFNTNLSSQLKNLLDPKLNNYFYLALPPHIISRLLGSILTLKTSLHFTNYYFLIEKPFGTNYHNAQQIARLIKSQNLVNQIYLADHYLFKKPIRDLTLTPKHQLQITALEKVGLENRVSYYDQVGALKDMIQSHFLNITFKLVPQLDPNLIQVITYKKGQYATYTQELSKPSSTETLAFVKLKFKNLYLTFLTAKKTALKLTTLTLDNSSFTLTDSNSYTHLFDAFFNRHHYLFPTISQTLKAWQIIEKIQSYKPQPFFIYPNHSTQQQLNRLL